MTDQQRPAATADADPFTADAEHLQRFKHLEPKNPAEPEEPRQVTEAEADDDPGVSGL